MGLMNVVGVEMVSVGMKGWEGGELKVGMCMRLGFGEK